MVTVYPSGRAVEPLECPIAPAPPERLITLTACPNSLLACNAMERASASVPPPASQGTMIEIGFEGNRVSFGEQPPRIVKIITERKNKKPNRSFRIFMFLQSIKIRSATNYSHYIPFSTTGARRLDNVGLDRKPESRLYLNRRKSITIR